MILSMNKNMLSEYVSKQLNYMCPDENSVDADILKPYVEVALNRYKQCFMHCILRGYREKNEVNFYHLNTDQYTVFLYFLMNSIYAMKGDNSIPSKIMNVSRIISGMFLSFKCKLPDHILLNHPVGTVLGNASYGDYLIVFQNVTVVTGSEKSNMPVIGRNVTLSSGVKVMENCIIGDNVSLGVNVILYDKIIHDNNVVTMENNVLTERERKNDICYAQRFYDIAI